MVGLCGSLPYLFAGVLPEFSDAFFESVSGFATTGATVMSGDLIDSMPVAIHFSAWNRVILPTQPGH